MLHYTRLERPLKDNRSSLLGKLVSYKENLMLWIWILLFWTKQLLRYPNARVSLAETAEPQGIRTLDLSIRSQVFYLCAAASGLIITLWYYLTYERFQFTLGSAFVFTRHFDAKTISSRSHFEDDSSLHISGSGSFIQIKLTFVLFKHVTLMWINYLETWQRSDKHIMLLYDAFRTLKILICFGFLCFHLFNGEWKSCTIEKNIGCVFANPLRDKESFWKLINRD